MIKDRMHHLFDLEVKLNGEESCRSRHPVQSAGLCEGACRPEATVPRCTLRHLHYPHVGSRHEFRVWPFPFLFSRFQVPKFPLPELGLFRVKSSLCHKRPRGLPETGVVRVAHSKGARRTLPKSLVFGTLRLLRGVLPSLTLSLPTPLHPL